MILEHNAGNDYLDKYKAGEIAKGAGIGCSLTDKHIRFKPNQLVTILGGDNVGKTTWLFWYLLCLSNKHGYTWIVWTGENAAGSVKRALIEMLAGVKLPQMTDDLYYKTREQVAHWFRFIDNKQLYKPKELLKIISDPNYNFNAAVIDPFTGLSRDMDHKGNYGFLNELVNFTNNSHTVYLTTHPNTEAARKRYPKDHDMWGYYMPLGKSDVEGGQGFANRTDDFWSIHRHTNHPALKYLLEVHVRKVKETETGGEPTDMDEPLRYEWNNGLGYTINGFDPLREVKKSEIQRPVSVLTPNNNFELEDDLPF